MDLHQKLTFLIAAYDSVTDIETKLRSIKIGLEEPYISNMLKFKNGLFDTLVVVSNDSILSCIKLDQIFDEFQHQLNHSCRGRERKFLRNTKFKNGKNNVHKCEITFSQKSSL